MQLTPIYSDYNKTTLSRFNYTIYGNGTVSNGSNCYLSFGIFHPQLFDNGSFHNGTSCDYPVFEVRSRGAIGIVLSVLLLLMIPVTLFNLRKHGRLYLEESRRFRTISRKWPWYWLFVVEALGAVAGFFSIDLDRDYIQGSSLTSYGAVYSATLPTSLAAVWELTRHWGSFEERKIHDEDPFRFRLHDRRSKVHIIMPIIFYGLGFLAFLLTVLRNWNGVASWHPERVVDTRWKAGGIMAVLAWVQVWVQIVITRHYYHVQRVPWFIFLALTLELVLLAFNLSYLWDYSYSPFNVHSNLVYVAVMGYLPLFLLVLVINLSGLARENEEKVILERRVLRDREQMATLMETQQRTDNHGGDESPEHASAGSGKDSKGTATALVNVSSADDVLSSLNSEPDRKSWFYTWFGAAPRKGKSWFSHNWRYIPFTSEDKQDRQKKVSNWRPWAKNGSAKSSKKWGVGASSNARPVPLAADPTNRAPPRDLRKKLNVPMAPQV